MAQASAWHRLPHGAGFRMAQAGGAGRTTPVAGPAPPHAPPPRETNGGESPEDLWCHVGLPRAGTFSTRSLRALPHHGSDAPARGAKARAFTGRYVRKVR